MNSYKRYKSVTAIHKGLNSESERSAASLPAADDVLLQQLLDDVADVGDVDFVDETVDGFLQRFPAHPLVRQTAEERERKIEGVA